MKITLLTHGNCEIATFTGCRGISITNDKTLYFYVLDENNTEHLKQYLHHEYGKILMEKDYT